MNREIDQQINKNESPIQMNDLLLLESFSNFRGVDFLSNDFSIFLCLAKTKKEMNIKLSLNRNIEELANDEDFVKNFEFFEIF